MPSFLADENLESYILAALSTRPQSADIVSVHQVGLAATDDRTILEWAAENDRIIVTRDVSSMRAYANARIRAGVKMPGLVIIQSTAQAGDVLDALENLALYSLEGEWEGLVLFIGSPPLATLGSY